MLLVEPAKVVVAGPQLIAAGTSLTIGQGLAESQAWPANLSLTNQPAYNVVNYGVGGVTIKAIHTSEANRAGDDVQVSGDVHSSIFCRRAITTSGYCLGRRRRACFGRVCYREGGEAGRLQGIHYDGLLEGWDGRRGTTFDTDKDLYDAVILSQWKEAGFDGVIDAGAILAMGCDGCNTNTTYFQSDQMHPTAAGQLLVAGAVSNRLNYDAGFNVDYPNYVSTASYTLAAGDGAVVNTATANAAWTMPDCTGQSGAVYTISNPQSAHTLTIVGGTNQPINGLTSAITIPSNSTVKLTDVPNAKTVSGCHWVM